jgi:3-phosphoshikimate 1-carboxyvinyltransferase
LSSEPLSSLAIRPARGPVRGRIRPPGSKSITNRALVCAALADGTSTLSGALDSEDTRVMIESLGRLGIRVDAQDAGRTLVVEGCGGQIPATEADLFVGNSGTTIRILTAMCALGRGKYRLDGVARMRERPIGDLLTALNELGASCRGEEREGFPPVIVETLGLRGGEAHVQGNVSSQFLSGLLMAAPRAAAAVELVVEGYLVSQPYVAMTVRIMQAFGVRVVAATDWADFGIPAPQTYAARNYAIEPDASAASYFWGAAAITGGDVVVERLSRDSLQGDVRFAECLAQMGCQVDYSDNAVEVSGRAERGIDVDMNDISDTVQTLAAVALFAAGPTTIRGVAHIRHKETDRIGDLARELRKFGATVEELPDGLRITPARRASEGRISDRHTSETLPEPITIETYNDHRMAMSLALAGLVRPGVTIANPLCTAKTYPAYFDDLAKLVSQSPGS